MRKLLFPTLALGLLAATAHATSAVHISLKPNAAVTADADGFFSLGAISDLSGGDANERAHLRGVPVGRAPIPDQIRLITPGDVLLKMRQAGLNPASGIVLDGAKQVSVTLNALPLASAPSDARSHDALAAALPVPPGPPLIHRGDTITVLFQDGELSISAKGVARDVGRAGDTIRVHRDGVMNDLSAIVIDAQTVQLEL